MSIKSKKVIKVGTKLQGKKGNKLVGHLPLNLYRLRYFLGGDLHGSNHSSESFVHMLVSNFGGFSCIFFRKFDNTNAPFLMREENMRNFATS